MWCDVMEMVGEEEMCEHINDIRNGLEAAIKHHLTMMTSSSSSMTSSSPSLPLLSPLLPNGWICFVTLLSHAISNGNVERRERGVRVCEVVVNGCDVKVMGKYLAKVRMMMMLRCDNDNNVDVMVVMMWIWMMM